MIRLVDIKEEIKELRSEIGALEYQIELKRKELRDLIFEKGHIILEDN